MLARTYERITIGAVAAAFVALIACSIGSEFENDTVMVVGVTVYLLAGVTAIFCAGMARFRRNRNLP